MAKSLGAQMKSLKSQQLAQKAKVKEQARKNAVVSKGTSKSGYATKKDGVPLDHAVKQDVLNSTDVKFGMNLGITKNMDNYESLRVDVWATDTVMQGETLEEAYTRLRDTLEEVLEETVSEYAEED